MTKIRVTSLGSGSKGNATLIEFKTTRLLVDCGFSCRELESRLNARQIPASSITAVLATHEHSDHFNGIPVLANKYQIPVWMSHGTSLHQKAAKATTAQVFNSHQAFTIGELEVNPVLVPHDSREACQFVIQGEDKRVGILTDLGHITPFVSQQYQDCDILLLEFNHDLELLMKGKYPPALKARVSGSLGHLSNRQAAEFLIVNNLPRLKHLAAMHLSEENNCEVIVQQIVSNSGLQESVNFVIANQNSGFDWLEA